MLIKLSKYEKYLLKKDINNIHLSELLENDNTIVLILMNKFNYTIEFNNILYSINLIYDLILDNNFNELNLLNYCTTLLNCSFHNFLNICNINLKE